MKQIKQFFLRRWEFYFKCYLHCKTITSRNVPSEAQIKIFLFRRKIVPFSRYSSFCILNHPMIYQICDVMMSISTWDKVHFWIYVLNLNSRSHQTWPVDRYKQGQYFSVIFWIISRTGAKFQDLFSLPTSPNYSITKYVKFPVFHFLKMWTKDN